MCIICSLQLILKLNNQERFRSWLQAAKEECEWTLNSLLIEPIQRIPRYELLLKDLLKYTAVDHPDTPLLREALAFVQKVNQCSSKPACSEVRVSRELGTCVLFWQTLLSILAV
jgi:hypothetical protein